MFAAAADENSSCWGSLTSSRTISARSPRCAIVTLWASRASTTAPAQTLGGLIMGVVDGFERWRAAWEKCLTNQPSYTVLVHQVIQAAPEPLPFDEIMQRVQRSRPIDTKNPPAPFAAPSARAGSLPTRAMGVTAGCCADQWLAHARLTLAPSDLDGKTIGFGEHTRAPVAGILRINRGAISPDRFAVTRSGRLAAMALVHVQGSQWGMAGRLNSAWFTTLHAAPGDHLLLSAVDERA
jgi:hypothetical protein